jgi:hypothetical protein
MKLSDFKKTNLAKKLQFVDGEATLIEYDKLDGDINFYSLDENVFNKIGDEVIKNLSPNEKDEVFVYKLIPYLCDIEVDISMEEFEDFLKSTNKNFIKFMETIMQLVNDTTSMADSINNIEKTAKEIGNKLDVVVETDEQKLDRLYEELEKADNRNSKRRILREINILEEKMI